MSPNLQEFCSRVCWLNQRAWSHSTCLWHLQCLHSPLEQRCPASPCAGSWPTSPPTTATVTPPSPLSSGVIEACWVTAAGWEALCWAWRGRVVGTVLALRAGRPCLWCPTAGWSQGSSTLVSSPPQSTHPSRNEEACACLTPTLEGGTPARHTWEEDLWVWVHPAASPPLSIWPPDSSSRGEGGDTVVRAEETTHHASTMSAWASKRKQGREHLKPHSGSLQEIMYIPWPPRTRLSVGGWSQHLAHQWSMASRCLCAGHPRKDTSSAATAWSPSPFLHPPCPLPVARHMCPSNTPPGWAGLCWEEPLSEGSWVSWWISASWWVRRTAVIGLRLASDYRGNEGVSPRPELSVFNYTDLSVLILSVLLSLPFYLPYIFISLSFSPSDLLCQSLRQPPPSTPWWVSLSLWLAAGSATHITAHTNWSDGLRLLLCLHCRASLSWYSVAARRGRRDDGEEWEKAEWGAERMWTETKMDIAFRGCPLCAD